MSAAGRRQKVVVLELNEVPLRVLQRYAAGRPASAVSRILAEAEVRRTQVTDVADPFLYPAQTWASFNTGVPYDEHHIHWYNDPKPPEFPFYWQDVAAAGRSVGLVNTLHSSPLERVLDSGDFRFLIPDCFANERSTLPRRYEGFQEMNLELTQENSRVSVLRSVVSTKTLRGLAFPGDYGLNAKSVREIVATVAGIAIGAANKERLRNLQFPLLGEIFLREMQRTDVELGVLFTNHVAANLHRYWYAWFREDFPDAPYEDDWAHHYRSEIGHAMDMLDRYLAR